MNKRTRVEEYIFALMDDFDKFGGTNRARYTKLFASMNNKAFDEYMQLMRLGKTRLTVILPNDISKLTTNAAIELAKKRNVQLFSKIYLHDTHSRRKYLTKYPMMVVTLPVRRLGQYLFHKISLPDSDSHVNPITGQVIPPDKGASLSAIETQILASKGLDTSIVELIKVRAGDMTAYKAMKHTIEDQGEIQMTDLPLTGRPRSVITAQKYLHGMMIDSTL